MLLFQQLMEMHIPMLIVKTFNQTLGLDPAAFCTRSITALRDLFISSTLVDILRNIFHLQAWDKRRAVQSVIDARWFCFRCYYVVLEENPNLIAWSFLNLFDTSYVHSTMLQENMIYPDFLTTIISSEFIHVLWLVFRFKSKVEYQYCQI